MSTCFSRIRLNAKKQKIKFASKQILVLYKYFLCEALFSITEAAYMLYVSQWIEIFRVYTLKILLFLCEVRLRKITTSSPLIFTYHHIWLITRSKCNIYKNCYAWMNYRGVPFFFLYVSFSSRDFLSIFFFFSSFFSPYFPLLLLEMKTFSFWNSNKFNVYEYILVTDKRSSAAPPTNTFDSVWDSEKQYSQKNITNLFQKE